MLSLFGISMLGAATVTRSRGCSLVWLCGPLLAACSARAADPVVFMADFSGTQPLPASGWEVLSGPSQSRYEARDGVLRVTCRQNPYEDGWIRARVPVIRRGMLEFEANIAMADGGNKLGVALTVSVYNISTWFHDYCKDWRRYFPAPPAARLPGFKLEPVGHRRLTAIKHGEWAHYRILFDHERGIVEYYRNDMRDPVYIDYDVPVLGRDEYEGGTIRIGSMGLTKGDVVYGIRSLVLKELPDGAASVAGPRPVLLFSGIGAERYGMAELALETFGAERLRRYVVKTHGAAIAPRNQLKLERLPSSATVAAASLVILADMPAQPGDCLPSALLAQIADAVEGGARLLVLCGPFSLGKGGYGGTPLEPVLPVGVGGPWSAARFGDLTPLGTPQGELTCGSGRAGVLWYHASEVREGADVLLTAAGKPMFASWAVGEGRVGLFLGTPQGEALGRAGVEPFWKSPAWRLWLREHALEAARP